MSQITTGAERQPAPGCLPPIGFEAELTCMLCGRTVGQIVNGRARQHAGCDGRLRIERRVRRCCHCDGPVYREPLGVFD